jgi:hypothetical protein
MLAFHQHIHRFTETVQWHGETVATITDLFYSVDAPIHAVVEQNSVVTPSTQSALSASGTNTSFLTARESNRLEADKDSLSMSDDELDDELHLRVAALRSVINKKKSRRQCGFEHSTGIQQQSKTTCELCGDPHDKDQCIKRGPAFWSECWSKTVNQFNLVHGDKPRKTATKSESTSGEKKVPLQYPLTAQFEKSSTTPQVHHLKTDFADITGTLEDDVIGMGKEIKNIIDDLENQVEEGVDATQLRYHCLQLHHQHATDTSAPGALHEHATLDNGDESASHAAHPLGQDSDSDVDINDFIYDPQSNW